MTNSSPPEDKNGVLIGPLYKGNSADQMAMNVFKLLSALGIRCSEISRVLINPKVGCAKIEVFENDCEDYLVKVLKEVRCIMSLYDLRKLLENPEQLRAVRIRHLVHGHHYQEISDGGTSTYRPTAGENMPPSTINEEPEVTITEDLKSNTLDVRNETPTNIEAKNTMKSSETTSSFQIEFEELEEDDESKIIRHQATSTSDMRSSDRVLNSDPASSSDSTQNPVMISAKTSTPGVYPCGCPETVFYHRFQQIGTETRYDEFKKGGVIHEQRSFRHLIAKYVCGFLNTEGGTIYLGVNDDGIILGVDVNKAMEETLHLDIDFAIRLIEPSVEKCEYSVNFARVMDITGQFSPDLKVLEVCVKPRKPPVSRYFYNDVIYIRRDGSLQAIALQNAKNVLKS